MLVIKDKRLCFALLISIFMAAQGKPANWFPGSKAESVTTLYAPGSNWSEAEICKYCNEYRASTGELIRGAADVPEVIDGSSAYACNFAEIELRRLALPDKTTQKRFAHLFSVFGKTVETFTKRLVEKKIIRAGIAIDSAVEQSNYSLNPHQLNLARYNGGQATDVAIFAELYANVCAKTSSAEDFAVFAASRGAATVYNFIARIYPQLEDKRVRVLVLEGCFDSISNVSVFSYALPFLAQYRRTGYSPIDAEQVKAFVETCNKEGITVLFISSDADKFVPLKNTQRLCSALKEAGLNELYLLILKGPSHPRYMKDVPAEAERYQAVVHAVYAQCGLPHDPELAKVGAEILPSLKL